MNPRQSRPCTTEGEPGARDGHITSSMRGRSAWLHDSRRTQQLQLPRLERKPARGQLGREALEPLGGAGEVGAAQVA